MQAILAVGLLAGAGCPALSSEETCNASPRSVAPEELAQNIGEVLARPEYAWRLPREKPNPRDADRGFPAGFLESLGAWIENGLRAVARWLKKLVEWLADHLAAEPPTARDVNWIAQPRLLLFILLAAAMSVLAVVLYRFWKRRRGADGLTLARVIAETPDIADEDIVADLLPPDEWMQTARDLMSEGKLRLAIRAMFMAALAHLAFHQTISIARHKSNREYLLELRRKAHDRPALIAALVENTAIFERAWYGSHAVPPAMVAAFEHNQETIFRAD
jgi:hypothetical protein